jgi:hypothetical protein
MRRRPPGVKMDHRVLSLLKGYRHYGRSRAARKVPRIFMIRSCQTVRVQKSHIVIIEQNESRKL